MPSPGSARGAEMNWRIPHRRAGAYLVDGSVGSPSLACASSIFKPASGWMEGLFRVHILRPSVTVRPAAEPARPAPARTAILPQERILLQAILTETDYGCWQ